MTPRTPPSLMNQEAMAIRRNRQGGERKAADEILALVFDNETGAEVGAGDVVIIDPSNERAVVFAAAKGDPNPVVVYMGGLDEASIRCVSSGVIVRIICDGDAITPGDLIVASATNKYGSKITAASLEGVLGTAVSSKAGAVTAEVQVLLSPSGFGYLSTVPTVINNWTRDAVNGELYPAVLTDQIGLGTANPDTLLHLLSSAAELRIETGDATDPTLSFKTTNTAHQIDISLDENLAAKDLLNIGNTLYIDGTNNRVGIGTGTATPRGILDVSIDPNKYITIDDPNNSFLSVYRYSNDANGSVTWHFKAKGTAAAPLVPILDDVIGGLGARIWDGDSFNSAGRLSFKVDGGVGADDTPTRFTIETSLDGTSNLVERLVIKNDGKVGIPTPAPDTLLHLLEGSAELRIETDDATDPTLSLKTTNTAHQIDISLDENAAIDVLNIANTLYVEDTNNRVGFGTPAPARKVHIVGTNGVVAGFPGGLGGLDELVFENNNNINMAFVGGVNSSSDVKFYESGVAAFQGIIGYNHNTDTFRIASGGNTDDVEIDASHNLIVNNGAVGVWIAAPLTNVHIYENNADTAPAIRVEQDGAGDAAINFLLTGGQAFSTGIDNSIAGDPFVLAAGADLQTNPWFMLTPAGVTWIGGVDGADYVEIGATGDLVFVGGAGLVFGGCYGDHIAWVQAAMVQNTWYNISDADISSMALNGVTHDGSGELTVTEPGMYLVSYSITYQMDHANEHIEVGIELNGSGSATAIGHLHAETKFANQEEALSGTCILDLADNTTVEVTVQTTDAGNPDILIDMLLLTVTQIGGT